MVQLLLFKYNDDVKWPCMVERSLRMTTCQGIFNIKLYEMERAFDHLQGRIQLCQTADHAKIQNEINTLTDKCLENEILLTKTSERSRTPFVAELAQAQAAFSRQCQFCLQQALASSKDLNEQAEAATLFAEFAIDQVMQAVNYAMLSAMHAIDRQLTADEATKEDHP